MAPPDGTVTSLADVGAGHRSVAGGKGANLGELIRAGFPVPPGFVITTSAYELMLEETGLAQTLSGLLQEDAEGGTIRAAFSGAAMPAGVRDAIAAAYRRLGSGAVAVRSSATAEDLPGAAFAGQQDTFLNVVGEEALLIAVAGCWTSLWTDRAISYRKRQGITTEGLAIAVVVQSMVDADVAGVMFCADPVTGRRDRIVLDAGRGLGEAVVSGTVTPEHYVMDRRGRLMSWQPGGSAVFTGAGSVPGASAAIGRSSKPALSNDQLTRLAGLCGRAVDHFGMPQDVEWAVAGGSVFLLQARPMTALPPEPADLNFLQKRIGPTYVEMFNERPYPLDVSGWLRLGLFDMLRRMAGSIGVGFPTVAQILPEEDGVVVRLVPPVPRPTFKILGAPASILARGRRFKLSQWTGDLRLAAYLAEVDRLNMQDPGQLDWAQALQHVRRIFAGLAPITDLRVSYFPGLLISQARLRSVLLLLGKSRLAPALNAGAPTQTSAANQELDTLAGLVRADPSLRAVFEQPGTPDITSILANPRYTDFAGRFDAFLRTYGHRETSSVVLSSSPTWSEAPEVVLGLVKVLVDAPPAKTDQTGNAFRELLAHPAMKLPRFRRLVLNAVEQAKAGMAFREDTHFFATALLPPLRKSLLSLGQQLQAAEIVEGPGEVFHLRFEELCTIADPARLTAGERDRWRSLVIARTAKRRELAAVPLLDLIDLFGETARGAGALVKGSGASRGTAAGAVRIILQPAEFGDLRSGEILVCPYTNPSWTPLFQRAAAVVVDTGGIGSHAAIVAREYGIPAVMGTRNGTSILTTGQRVTVDGGTGLVMPAT
ncbi:PEP/pyruvate-binding domain-containing protein [Arthrobacter sp. NPDC058130]|uniref:PEP/pyruvate-binding domain-containing protein n=1 Tax=Arthrobacter sp. NPDC058130 TaxID=3346353 RepID=UPI0036E8C330